MPWTTSANNGATAAALVCCPPPPAVFAGRGGRERRGHGVSVWRSLVVGLSKSVCSLHCYTSHQGCLCVLALLVPERCRRCPPAPMGPSRTNTALFRVGKTLSRRLWRSTEVHRRVYCWLRAPGVKQQTPLSKTSRLHNPHTNKHITSSRRQLFFFFSSTQFCCLNLIMTGCRTQHHVGQLKTHRYDSYVRRWHGVHLRDIWPGLWRHVGVASPAKIISIFEIHLTLLDRKNQYHPGFTTTGTKLFAFDCRLMTQPNFF